MIILAPTLPAQPPMSGQLSAVRLKAHQYRIGLSADPGGGAAVRECARETRHGPRSRDRGMLARTRAHPTGGWVCGRQGVECGPHVREAARERGRE